MSEGAAAAAACHAAASITAVRIERAVVDGSWWVAPAARLFDTEFGRGYVDEAALRKLAGAVDSAVFIAHRSLSLVGVAIISSADHSTRAHFARSFVSLGFTGAVSDGAAVGCLRSVVVEPAARGHGSGSRLIDQCMHFARRRGWDAVYAASWISGKPHQSAGLLARTGFTAVGTIADYWLQDTATDTMSCAVCGAPCHCAALIMRWRG
ncbi:GNAT family N-acetyltransferase [Nocardia carnea]|uniref:GNAT family N-acetyltransferase n=1 Tax=Nocardia carnea TaxID=37328 RepID=UPI0024576D18|nr:GNAT family N-acetyltransferase [Nocardia carnea]